MRCLRVCCADLVAILAERCHREATIQCSYDGTCGRASCRICCVVLRLILSLPTVSNSMLVGTCRSRCGWFRLQKA